MDIYELSKQLNTTLDGKYADLICQEMMDGDYTPNQCLYVFQQLKRFYLRNGDLTESEYYEPLYSHCLEGFINALGGALPKIPATVRNKNRVVVIALQFLGLRHAPTKTALERIATLQKMGKEVLVIHSMELLTLNGEIPFFNSSAGNVEKAYDGLNNVSGTDGKEFMLYQPAVYMPDVSEIEKIAMLVMEYAPYEIVMLGDHCILGDLLADMIPTVCIPMAFSTIPLKKNQLIATARTLTENDFELMEKKGIDGDNIIQTTFTFDVIKQTTKLTRKELGLPEDKFILSIVGIRLDTEVSKEFLQILKPAIDAGCHIAFAGKFEKYEEICAELEFIKDNSTFVGYQNDILAFEEVCDLYVNPPRLGGGFSVAEAFCMHKPGITTPVGDVAASSGSDFWVDSVEDFPETILRYKNDKVFYEKMADKAFERSKVLFDSVGAFTKIIDGLESWKGFF